MGLASRPRKRTLGYTPQETEMDFEGGIMRALSASLIGIFTALTVACHNSAAPFSPPYTPILPTSWAPAVTNPYFPLMPGTIWQYKEQTSGSGGEDITVEVLSDKRVVNGVAATAVRDRVFVNGQLTEDTFDWFAQDGDGNVWYVGESTKEYKNGVVTSTEGSWEWGVDGALPGIQMWADPAAKTGSEYRQEYYKGQAEDWGKVLAVGEAITVPFGSMTNCIIIEEWAGLESGSHETKTYCPQVGLVREGTLGTTSGGTVLISRTP